jgi:hypothetical protein
LLIKKLILSTAIVGTVGLTALSPPAHAGWGDMFARELARDAAENVAESAVQAASDAAAQQQQINAQACQAWSPIVTDMRYPFNYRQYAAGIAANYCH